MNRSAQIEGWTPPTLARRLGGKLMYDELVKELRDSAEWADRLALLMGRAEGDAHAPVMRKAASVIEELNKPYWIPVTERLPGSGVPTLICGDGNVVEQGFLMMNMAIGMIGAATGHLSTTGFHYLSRQRRNEHGSLYQGHGDAEKLLRLYVLRTDKLLEQRR